MNFFEHQAQARAHSTQLIFLFGLSVLAIVAAVDVVVLGALVSQQRHVPADAGFWQLARQFSGALTGASFVTLAIILLASLYKVSELGKGGSVVAKGLGAQPIAGSQDPRYRRLRNVIEEIAIASGVPVPQIFVLEQEPGINAFAAGYTPADAAITVTRGALDKLTRDELQGVIAHEFSHIVNGDMRLSIRLMGVIFGIIAIALLARGVLRAAGNSRGKGAGGVVMVALGVMIIGYIGVFFARLIKAGFSRERESLADACAVQFTRQTLGLAGALKKIAGLDAGSKFQVAEAEEVSHMLFGDGETYSSLFATHPPLLERIRALEPTFRLEQIEQQAKAWNEASFTPADAQADIAGFAPSRGTATPADVAARIGTPSPEHYRYGETTRASLPQPLKDLARDPAHARNLLLAMLLDPDAAVRKRQRAVLEARFGAAAGAIDAMEPQLAGLGPAMRLPLAAIAFPALRQRPRDELLQLVKAVSELSHADGGMSLFEFCMGCMLRTQVADVLAPAKAAVAGRLKLPECEGQVLQLLNALAQQGSEDPAAARRAFAAGLSHLLPRSIATYQARSDWAATLHMALLKLDRLCGPAKEILLEGMLKTIHHDGRLTTGEAELFRAVCAALHCPLPPLLDPTPG